jgi:hypothetical protein
MATSSLAQVLPLPIVEPQTKTSAPWSPIVRPPQVLAFPLTVVAEIDTVIDGDWTVFADTDRDGLMEIVSTDQITGISIPTVVVAERQPDNTFVVHYPLGLHRYLLTYATGDLDGDGKMEIIGQQGSNVYVYESAEPWEFPTRLAWTSPPLSNVGGHTTVGDSDGDGRMEIIHSRNTFSGTSRLVIFENRGDDEYVQVFSELTPGNAAVGEKVVLDLDQDGRREIAMGGSDGFVYIFESIADDTWQQVFVDSTGLKNAYAAEGGVDTDRNGKPELFVRGNAFGSEPPVWPAIVCEAVGDDAFVRVGTILVPGDGGGVTTDALGDLNGDGSAEYIARVGRAPWEPPGGLLIYSAVAEGNWQPVAFLEDVGSLMGMHYTCDLNSNGRPEIFWMGDLAWTFTPTSRVYAYEPTSDTIGSPASRTFTLAPNPIRQGATALVRAGAWSLAASTLAVHDVGGRLVARNDMRGQALEWRPRELAAGVYFVRLTDARGANLGAARVVVLPAE